MEPSLPPRPVGVPDLAVRPVEEGDLEACLELVRGHLAYPDDVLALLPRFWRRLLREEALNAVVVETHRRGSTMIAGFGASVFVTDTWMTDARRGEEPYLTARTVRSELGPDESPILRPATIANSNTDGLNVLILHYGESRDLPHEIRPPLRYRMFEAFIETNRGYRIKEVLQEFWDELDPEFITSGWGQVRSEYTGYFQRRGEPLPPAGRRPYLIGITREEVATNPGAIAAPLFIDTPPRFGFTPGEQRLLRHALTGQTDIELAKTLGVAVSTVKSRWRGIYQRVGRQVPDLVVIEPPAEQPQTARGQEKRRRLLEYLRRHPEELHPGLSRMK